ncbi:MAG: four helix bundle protein [Planctomycetota bacterium]
MASDSAGYRELIVWQRAMSLCEAVYAFTRGMTESERYGLSSQMQRAAVSVPSNIAEGYGRGPGKDYAKHLRYARGSLAELETQVELAVRCELATRNEAKPVWSLAQETGKLLTRLIQSQTRQTPPQA